MTLAGLTGGMACGKTFVALTFATLGAHIIEADDLGREVLQPGGEAYSGVVQEFGREVLAHDGTIDRSRLAEKVFNHPAALSRLNALVHPAVRARAISQAERIFAAEPKAVVIYVAAILIESGAYKECQKLIVATCSPEVQLKRAMERGTGQTEAEVRSRLARQMPLDAKLRYADYIIDTNGTKQETVRQTKLIYEELVELALKNS